MKTITTIAVLFILTLEMAQAEPREKHEKCEKHESHNYIIERQEAGLVQGVPTMRRIIGKREIDIYSDGSMYEKNNFVGYDKR
jgi:hypothetical protein